MKNIRYRIEYVVVLLGARLIQLLTLEQTQAFARLLGAVAYHLGVARPMALANLKLAFPEKSEVERRAIAKAAYQQFATTMLELFRLPIEGAQAIGAMFEFEGLEIMERLKAEKRPAICHSAHFGNWEWMATALVAKGFPIILMIGTQSNPYVDALFNRYRASVGMRFVRIRSIRDVIKALKEGDFAAAVGDQDGDKWGRFVKLFGIEASTHIFWEGPADRADAAILFGVPERLGPRRHRLRIYELPQPPDSLDEAQASAFRLQAMNDLLEAAVRRDPSMWLWMHHRFLSKAKHRLDGLERERAERGEIVFDTVSQYWVEAATGSRVEIASWKR